MIATTFRYSAPSFWNQGKALGQGDFRLDTILRAEFLESRQSGTDVRLRVWRDTPRRVFGIKAKHTLKAHMKITDTPRRVFGIKAKHEWPTRKNEHGYSAPSFWNQGKAYLALLTGVSEILRAEFLESRQSRCAYVVALCLILRAEFLESRQSGRS